MQKVECFSPMLCHCKVACTNSTISLMFGCKVGGNMCLCEVTACHQGVARCVINQKWLSY